MTIVFCHLIKKINSLIIMTYISIVYAIITTMILTLFLSINIYNSSFLPIILNSLIIIIIWLCLFIHILYQNYYINLLYLFLGISLGTIIIIYLINYIIINNNNQLSYYTNPKIISGIVTEVLDEDNKRPIITFEYTVNNVKYTNSSDQYNFIVNTNYKKNDKIKIIYSSDTNPEYSSIYDETITYYTWIYIILLVILLILLWTLFIYNMLL